MDDSKVVKDGKHFGYWKMQTIDLMYAKELEDALLETKPDSMSSRPWKKLDRRALGILRNIVSILVSSHIVDETMTYDFMKKLSNLFEKSSGTNRSSPSVVSP